MLVPDQCWSCWQQEAGNKKPVPIGNRDPQKVLLEGKRQ
jgi:hypothetical protein